MPLSRRLAIFNRRVTNHLTRHIAGWAPGFGLIEHVGRRTGRRHETPVNIFIRQGRYVVALTYGECEWVRNVLAAHGCAVRTRRHRVELANPERVHDPSRQLVPIPARWILKLMHVEDFMVLRAAP